MLASTGSSRASVMTARKPESWAMYVTRSEGYEESSGT
jgi:hypothetical protein